MKIGRVECTNKSHETLTILGWVLGLGTIHRIGYEDDEAENAT